jgi:F-type H+-transporting ATPase subunit b
MVHMLLFAAEGAHEAAEAAGGGSPLAALGVDLRSFIFQIITFILVLILLKRFAFTPISKKLAERRQTIDDGVRMGLRMEKEKAKLDEDVAKTMREARHEADQIIAAAHKDAREVIRKAEKDAQRKVDAMLADAEERAVEESEQARKKLEKDIVGLVSEATETIVGEKVDTKRDAELVAKALKGQKK